jgi:hypothetical protein
MPIEKIHEFGFVLRGLQLLIVAYNTYNLLLALYGAPKCSGTRPRRTEDRRRRALALSAHQIE